MKDKDLQSKIKQLTLKLVSLKALILAQYSVGDKDLLQFTEFLSKEKVTNNYKFSTFSRKTQWLDDLYFDDIRFYEKYPKLSAVMQIVLFIFKLNQNDDTIVAGRFIKDCLKAHQVQPHTLVIDQKMVCLFKSSWRMYNIHLENTRENEKKR